MPTESPPRKIVIATGNAHKTQEFRDLLGTAWQVEDLRDHPELPIPEETGTTFAENAATKALSASRALGPGFLVVADDSGLEVDALNGAPGVTSARYAGPAATDADNRAKLLAALAAAGARGPARRGRFRCVLVVARGGEILGSCDGTVEGILGNEEQGQGGFGYDSLFIPDGYGETFGQLPASVKHSLSHRGCAARKLPPILEKYAPVGA
ncbi:MAG: RdgB/HAM1 family non-canonical purine NTP pyrophosphatase [Verrucomicrobiales bacterium]|nr:RdgB/HAM1 family non-canonical purine NTP pyrophosphatase [Verrucomicrobiales bacterium]